MLLIGGLQELHIEKKRLRIRLGSARGSLEQGVKIVQLSLMLLRSRFPNFVHEPEKAVFRRSRVATGDWSLRYGLLLLLLPVLCDSAKSSTDIGERGAKLVVGPNELVAFALQLLKPLKKSN